VSTTVGQFLTCTDVTAGYGFAITAPFAGTSLCFSKCLAMRSVIACALDATLEMAPENSHYPPLDLSPLLLISTNVLPFCLYELFDIVPSS
jgi:hypothetical protein